MGPELAGSSLEQPKRPIDRIAREMPILNPNDEDFTGELAADPPVALRSALEASRSAFYDASHNVFDYAGFAQSTEFDELRDPTTITSSHSGAIALTASCRFWVA